MSDYTPDLAYLLVTAWDVAMHPEIQPGMADHLNRNVNEIAALYAIKTGCAEVYVGPTPDGTPRLMFWSDIEDVVRHARTTVKDAFADGWLPSDATAPF